MLITFFRCKCNQNSTIMNNRDNIWIAIVTLLVGVILLCLPSVTLKVIVMILGIILMVAGVIYMLMAFNSKNPDGTKRNPEFLAIITSLVAFGVGLWWVIDPGTQKEIIVRLFGVMAALSGAYRIYDMKVTFGAVRFPAAFYILPMLVLVFGIVMIFMPNTFADSLVMIVGIILIVYAVAMLCQSLRVSTFKPLKQKEEATTRKVEDVKATEVKENKDKDNNSPGSWASDR